MTGQTITLEHELAVRNESASYADVRLTVNPWASIQIQERSYGTPRAGGFGARRTVVKYTEVLRQLGD